MRNEAKGRVSLYLADIRPLYAEAAWKRAYAYVDEGRRKKADACKLPQARAASLAVGVLARFALVQNGYGEYDVCYGEKGQPLLQNGLKAGGQGVWLSLSHSGDYAVCALADRPVGVDIQKRMPVRAGMLRHFFSDAEGIEFVRRFGLESLWEGSPDGKKNTGCAIGDAGEKPSCFLPEEAAIEFLRLWTVKESYMKLDGAGMGLGFSNISADLRRGLVWERARAQKACRIQTYRAPEGYFLTACTAQGDG